MRQSSACANRKPSRQRFARVLVAVAGSGLIALLVVGTGAIVALTGSDARAETPADQPSAESSSSSTHELYSFFENYCSDCHLDGSQSGEFAYDRYPDVDSLKNDRRIWERTLKLLKLGAMPPPDMPQPREEERQAAVGWLNRQLFFVDCSQPVDPGRVTVRRLNRTEYNNTVRDLLGVDFQPADDFPADDSGHGFDNLGDVLTVPPLLLEKYLAAAERISEEAVRPYPPTYHSTRIHGFQLITRGSVRDEREEKRLSEDGSAAFYTFDLPRNGRYRIRVRAKLSENPEAPGQLEFRIGEDSVGTTEVATTDWREYVIEHDAPVGTHEVAAVFISRISESEQTEQQESSENEGRRRRRNRGRTLDVSFIEVEGPLEFTQEELRLQPFVKVLPTDDVAPFEAAKSNLREFLPLAFRRSVANEEIELYAGLTQRALDHGKPYHEAMQMTLQAVLVSPHFLFRIENCRKREGSREWIDDFALASRLSYFLWSSQPDHELFELAGRNELHNPDVLREQTLRMLNDPRADSLVENFAAQWLGLRKLERKDANPDPSQYPAFDDELSAALQQETRLFFSDVLRNNRSIHDLLTGRFTFLNERLAKHYGIDGITGPEFRRYEFKENEQRSGVLTQGSVLLLTSHPTRTSPVKRGEWVLSNLLGDTPPAPPPSVPNLEDSHEPAEGLTLRQQMERHRADPGCAACHKTMDSIGFGLQNFDVVGRWRAMEGEHPVDASGTLPSGESFNGPLELVSILSSQKREFARCLTEKMMTFALGRSVEWYDRCAVDGILDELEQDDRFRTLILGIVQSDPFQIRRARVDDSPGDANAVSLTDEKEHGELP